MAFEGGKTIDSRYLYDNHWAQELAEASARGYEVREAPRALVIEDGTILPTKRSPEKTWGIGGALDADGNFVDDSRVGVSSFGGPYEYDESEVEHIDGTVIYIPIIPMHWGHFLIDVLCRMWYFLEETADQNCPILYCKWTNDPDELAPNYCEMLDLLGIDRSRLHLVKNVTRCQKIILPTATFSFREGCHPAYTGVIDAIVERAMQSDKIRDLSPHECIYLSRRRFKDAKLLDVGESDVEECFAANGFAVLYPETLSATEQIFYINSCKQMACMSGTVAHNAMFGSPDIKLSVLNRTCVANPPQISINALFHIDCTYVDVYSKWIESHPKQYGDGPIWIEVNDNLRNYLCDAGLTVPSKNYAAIGASNAVRFFGLSAARKVGKSVARNEAVRKVLLKLLH